MNTLTQAIDRVYPGVSSFENNLSSKLNKAKDLFDFGKHIAEYALKNKDSIIQQMQDLFYSPLQTYANNLQQKFADFTQGVVEEFKNAYKPLHAQTNGQDPKTYTVVSSSLGQIVVPATSSTTHIPQMQGHDTNRILEAPDLFSKPVYSHDGTLVYYPNIPLKQDNIVEKLNSNAYSGSTEKINKQQSLQTIDELIRQRAEYLESHEIKESKPELKKSSKNIDDIVYEMKDDFEKLQTDYEITKSMVRGLTEKKRRLHNSKRQKQYGKHNESIKKANTMYTGTVVQDHNSKKQAYDSRYLLGSQFVYDLYNKGFNTKYIRREGKKYGHSIQNYDDITGRVATMIGLGYDYTRNQYNKLIAEKVGADQQIIQEYIQGKTYRQIRESFGYMMKGMQISNTSILRVLHSYEKKTGSKLVGKRRKNSNI
jgi:hypothetical protein